MKEKMIILLIALVVVSSIVAFGENLKKSDVVIRDELTELTVNTTAKTVGELLELSGISTSPTDLVVPSKDETLTDGMEVVITRAHDVKVITHEGTTTINTTFTDVKAILDIAQVEYDDLDIISPAIDEKIGLDRRIYLTDVEMDVQENTAALRKKTVVKYIDDESPNTHYVKTEGSDGLVKETVEALTVDENLVSAEMNTEVVQQAEDRVEVRGLSKYLVFDDGSYKRYIKSIVMRASAYDLSFASTGKNPGDPAYGITKMGTVARHGVVAVDPRVIRLGSNLYVESMDGWSDYGYARAEDIGGAIKGDRIDLFIASRSTALRFGRRNVRVYVLE